MMKKVILTGISAAVVGVLAFFSAITVTFVPGVAALYPAAAFEAAFGVWFGLWGAIASYIGLIIAGTAGGWFAILNGLVLSASDFLLAAVPMAAVRFSLLDPELPNWKDVAIFLAAGLFGSFSGSLLYNWYNMYLGLLAGWNSFWVAVAGWNLGNIIILIVIGVPLLRFGTPIIKRADLYVQSWS